MVKLDIYKEQVLSSVKGDLIFAGYALTDIESRGVEYLADNKRDPVFIVNLRPVETTTKMERVVSEAPKTKHAFGVEFPYFVVASNSEREEVFMHQELFDKLGDYTRRLRVYTVV